MADGILDLDGRTVATAWWGDPAVTGSLDAGAFALPTGTVAFLLTDVEGSTAMWETDADTMATAMVRHDAIIDAAVSAHGGVRPTAQGEGDSIVAAFPRASDAVLAARDAQQALGLEAWPTTVPLKVRMAIHTGEARFVDATTYAGQAIIRTARLRAIAHGGQVLISAAARDLTIDQLGDQVTMVDLGEHRLRDLARPERVWQLDGQGLAVDFEPLASLDTLPHNLPIQLTSFIGRVDEIATVARLVASERLVTIAGAGGAGKTRLALRVAAEVLDAFADGVWWVELAEVTDADVVVAEIAAAIGVRGEVGPGATTALAERLYDRKLLVVLDNCEHLVAAVAAVADGLLRRCPELSILATSREPLEVSGELAWRIPPLGFPPTDAGPVPLSALSQHDGVRLFLDRAQRVRPNFHLDDRNAPAVAAICQRLDGIPLAIELAAARCRSLTPSQIHGGLADAFRLLTGGGRVSLARQSTLEASINWSYELLSPGERSLLCRLAVFNGGCTLDDAEAIVADDVLPAHAVLDLLDRLVAQSLVQLDDGAGASRYRLLETVRQYGMRRLEAGGDVADLRRRHADHFRRRLFEVQPTIFEDDPVLVLRWVVPELDNVWVALDHLAAAGEWETYVEVAARISMMLTLVAPERGFAAIDRALGPDVILGPSARAKALWARGWARMSVGGIALTPADLAAGAELAAEVGDLPLQAQVSALLAFMALRQNPEMASQLQPGVIELAARSRAPFVEYTAHLYFAHAYAMHQSDLEAAHRMFAEIDRLAPSVPSGIAVAGVAAVRAYAGWVAGDLDDAELELAPARRFMSDLAELAPNEAYTRTSSAGSIVAFAEALVSIARGRRGPEVERLASDVALAEREGFAAGYLTLGMAHGLDLLVQGDVAVARGSLARVEEGGRERALAFTTTFAGVLGGLAALADGDLPAARQQQDGASALAVSHELGYCDALCRGLRALVALAEGDVDVAYDAVHDAFGWSVLRGYKLLTVDTLETLASIVATSGDHAEVARLAGMADRARNDLDYRMRLSGHREPYEVAVAAAVSALGTTVFDDAHASGVAVPFDEVVAYVTRSRGDRRRPTVGWDSLTPTERQVVELVIEGRTNAEVADQLLMGRETVKTHLAHVYTKLGLRSRTELTARAKDRQASAASADRT